MPEIEKNKKMPPIPEQFPEIERSCRHEGVYHISDYPLEVVPIHSKVIFDMSNYRFNGHPSPEVLPHLSFLIGAVIFPGSTRKKDARAVDHFFALVAPVTEYRLRSRSGDVFNLIQDRWKGMAIVGIVLEVHHPDKNIVGFGHGKGNLGAEFILLVILALSNTAHVRFMQTVYLVFAVSFLVMNPCKKVELIRIPGQPLLGKLALQFPDQNTGHGSDPFDHLVVLEPFHQQAGKLSFEASAQLDTAFSGDMAAFLNDLSQEFDISGKGDVLFLDSSVHHNFLFLGLVAMKLHRNLEDQLSPFLSNSLSEVGQIRRITGELPSKPAFTTESLIIGVTDPGLNNFLITEVFQLLENKQSDHEPDGLGPSPFVAVKINKSILYLLPGYLFAQHQERILGIELVHKFGIEEVTLLFSADSFWFHVGFSCVIFDRFITLILRLLVEITTLISRNCQVKSRCYLFFRDD